MDNELKCPGRDARYWKFEDVFESLCAHCGQAIEFFKDDPERTCPHCGRDTANPKIDPGCAATCRAATECRDALPEQKIDKPRKPASREP